MIKSQEIRNKIKSTVKTQKITNAMQMVAAGKRRRTEASMQTSMPYANKINDVIQHISTSSSEYRNHPYLKKREPIKRIGLLIISTDRGLCGGLNINLFKKALLTISDWQETKAIKTDLFLIGGKAATFFKNLEIGIRTQIKSLGDKPLMSDIIGTAKAMLDVYAAGEIDAIYIAYNEFINTMVQKPKIEQLVPIPRTTPTTENHKWDYIYEPDSIAVLQTLLVRHIETQIYQAIVDNIACEQAARMVAMKNATENANEFILGLKLAYNKARQTAITQEIAEIIGGASAV